MDIDLLSKIVKELILKQDEVSLPGIGVFTAEMVPAAFSDRGYTINPPYRRLYFVQREAPQERSLIEIYARSNRVDEEAAEKILKEFLGEMKSTLKQKKTLILTGLGRLRATRENNFFFVPDEDLDVWPDGLGLEPISLKSHKETAESLAADMASISSIITEATTAKISSVVVTPEAEVPPAAEEVSDVNPDEITQSEAANVSDAEEVPDVNPAAQPETEEITNPKSQSEATETADSTEAAGQEISKPKQRRKGLGWRIVAWTFMSLIITAILAVAAFAWYARKHPGTFDKYLYTPEELEIINH